MDKSATEFLSNERTRQDHNPIYAEIRNAICQDNLTKSYPPSYLLFNGCNTLSRKRVFPSRTLIFVHGLIMKVIRRGARLAKQHCYGGETSSITRNS